MSEARSAAIKSITAAMETDVGRKIITRKMLVLTDDNRVLKRKVAEDRIAVHALNELSIRLIDILHAVKNDIDAQGVSVGDGTKNLIKSVQMFQREAFGEEMSVRINGILGDETGDDLLLEDLIGKQPKETTNG